MKINSLSALLLASLLTSSIACAEGTPQDVSATIAITGKLNSSAARCQVKLSRDVVVLNASVSQLIPQGNKANDAHYVSIFINNAGYNNTDDSCAQAAKDGKIGVKFIGDADDADGTTLANSSYVTENGAKGVGIGIFDANNTPVAINSDTLTVSDGTSATDMFGVQLVKLTNQNVTPGNVYARLTVEVERL
ncbi:fimbrial protein [Cronobacter malonaticus]